MEKPHNSEDRENSHKQEIAQEEDSNRQITAIENQISSDLKKLREFIDTCVQKKTPIDLDEETQEVLNRLKTVVDSGEIDLYFDYGKVHQNLDQAISEHRGQLLFEGFKTRRMPMPIFYIHPDKWAGVCNEKEYFLQELALNILEQHTSEMLELITPPNSKKIRIYDFGIGTGEKGEIIAEQAVKRDAEHIEYHGVDASAEMLRIAMTKIANTFMEEALTLRETDIQVRRTNPWKDLIKFLKNHNLEYSSLSPAYLEKSFTRIFSGYYKNPDFNLIKYLFAKILSLHKKDPKQQAKIDELDNDIQLPISLHAHPKWFEQFKKEEFIPEEDEGVVIFDLGSNICNQPLDQSVKRFYDALAVPELPDTNSNGLISLKDEGDVSANYAVLGLQLGEIPQTQKRFRELHSKITKAYNNSAFRALTADPFLQGDVEYRSLDSKEPLNFEDIGFIYVDYEEDKERPGYYLATHRLYITEDVEILNAEGESIIIKGKEKAHEAFQKTVEVLFAGNDKKKKSAIKGKGKEMMRKLRVTSKNELLKVDIKTFFSTYYGNYGNGMKIAEDVLKAPINLEQILLYPSYKPSLEQIVSLCHEGGLKVIKVFVDNENHPAYCKILTRKMTNAEEQAYSDKDRDPNIFFTPEVEFPNTPNS